MRNESFIEPVELRGAMARAPREAFLLPGPVTMHHRVLQAMARPAMNHRGPEFKKILSDVRTLTQYLFGTRREVAVLSGSGTAGLEAAVTGLVRKGDRVLNLVNGKFSERFHELCQVFSTPTALTFEWGTAVRPERVAEALDAEEYRAVTLCWNETSTGLTNPIADIAKVVKAHDVLLIVDGITAVGGLENRIEAWGIDALVVGSQNASRPRPALAPSPCRRPRTSPSTRTPPSTRTSRPTSMRWPSKTRPTRPRSLCSSRSAKPSSC
jgi:aspartate aminotransferase-like enzyme